MFCSNDRVLIAMSGGVDSSVAAWLSKNSGASCTGVTMRLLGDTEEGGCCTQEDSEDARVVCANLRIPYYVWDFRDSFKHHVMENFAAEYARGATPNPCIACNRQLKFGKLLSMAVQTGFDYLVTGHYAQIAFCQETGRWQLRKAVDANKDQSYVLYMLTQEQLARLRLPLGELTKVKVREIAQTLNLRTAIKPESQDICFIPTGNYADWLIAKYPELGVAGDIVDADGRKLGSHRGIVHYTIGQRKGIGIASDKPYYVCDIDAQANRVIISRESGLYKSHARLVGINLIEQDTIKGAMKLLAKHRYRSSAVPAQVEQLDSDELFVTFLSPEKALTPGQAIVLYNGDSVFGGGTIAAVS